MEENLKILLDERKRLELRIERIADRLKENLETAKEEYDVNLSSQTPEAIRQRKMLEEIEQEYKSRAEEETKEIQNSIETQNRKIILELRSTRDKLLGELRPIEKEVDENNKELEEAEQQLKEAEAKYNHEKVLLYHQGIFTEPDATEFEAAREKVEQLKQKGIELEDSITSKQEKIDNISQFFGTIMIKDTSVEEIKNILLGKEENKEIVEEQHIVEPEKEPETQEQHIIEPVKELEIQEQPVVETDKEPEIEEQPIAEPETQEPSGVQSETSTGFWQMAKDYAEKAAALEGLEMNDIDAEPEKQEETIEETIEEPETQEQPIAEPVEEQKPQEQPVVQTIVTPQPNKQPIVEPEQQELADDQEEEVKPLNILVSRAGIKIGENEISYKDLVIGDQFNGFESIWESVVNNKDGKKSEYLQFLEENINEYQLSRLNSIGDPLILSALVSSAKNKEEFKENINQYYQLFSVPFAETAASVTYDLKKKPKAKGEKKRSWLAEKDMELEYYQGAIKQEAYRARYIAEIKAGRFTKLQFKIKEMLERSKQKKLDKAAEKAKKQETTAEKQAAKKEKQSKSKQWNRMLSQEEREKHNAKVEEISQRAQQAPTKNEPEPNAEHEEPKDFEDISF